MVCSILLYSRYGFNNYITYLMSENIELDFENGFVLPIDKPYRWTSFDVVRKVKGKLRGLGHKKIKVGHAGTLDPLATGILLVCVGKATKRANDLQAERKEYVAEIALGATTPSYDLEKEIDATYPYEHITEEMVQEALGEFIGEQEQVPPIFSAKFIDGKRAYEYARKGEEVEMRSSIITIYDAELLSFSPQSITVRMECSKGTYVRSFARDIALRLGSGGHLTALRRTRSGIYNIEESLQMDNLNNILGLSETK